MNNNDYVEQSGVDEGVAGVRVDDGLMMTLKILPGGKYVVGSPPEAKLGDDIDGLTGCVEAGCARAMEH